MLVMITLHISHLSAVEELTTNSLKSIKRMYMESKIASKECFLECVAPGQEEELQSYLSESSDDEEPKIHAMIILFCFVDAGTLILECLVNLTLGIFEQFSQFKLFIFLIE